MTVEQALINAGRQADSEHPERLRTNRNVDCFNHTSRVLELMGKPWSYVGKTAGEGQYTPPGFVPFETPGRDGKLYTITGVSHDAVTNGPLVYDLLGGGNDGPDPLGTPANVQAMNVPPEHHRPQNPPIPYPLSGTAPNPQPQPGCVFPPRDQGLAFFTALDAKYKSHGEPATTYYVNVEGTAVWYAEYLRHRTAGVDHAGAQRQVFADIDKIWS